MAKKSERETKALKLIVAFEREAFEEDLKKVIWGMEEKGLAVEIHYATDKEVFSCVVLGKERNAT